MMPRLKASPLAGFTATSPRPDRDFVVGRTYLVTRGDAERPATALNSRRARNGMQEAYVTFAGEDKRLDAWIPSSALGAEVAAAGPSRLAGALEALDNGPGTNGAASPAVGSERSTPEREHELVTRVRNFEDVRFGEYLIRTWYYSPYPTPLEVAGTSGSASALADPKGGRGRKRKEAPGEVPALSAGVRVGPRSANDVFTGGVGKEGEGSMGRLWVCDLCFKYMRTRAAWDHHTSSCKQLQPPGRKVYQRGSYSIWEIDGAQAQLYSQNLCLFGKLFIDHKTIYFHTENFLFYVLCDAATSRRDQVMAFFSKEKVSYDDYNLACIIAFPPFQNRGFGKLLIEFSYYLTRHPSTRSASGSPGTPERPLSDLGLKGYMAYWASVVLRFCRSLLADAAAPPPPPEPKPATSTEGRSLRVRKPPGASTRGESVIVNGIEITKTPTAGHKGQYAVSMTLKALAKACHLRVDDTVLIFKELGFLQCRRKTETSTASTRRRTIEATTDAEEDEVPEEPTEWTDVEIVITRDAVDEQWTKWRVRNAPMLSEEYVLL